MKRGRPAVAGSVLHGSFTVAREINAPLARVWDAYSVERSRAAWRRLPGPDSVLSLDFRAGGWERLAGSGAGSGNGRAPAGRRSSPPAT